MKWLDRGVKYVQSQEKNCKKEKGKKLGGRNSWCNKKKMGWDRFQN